MSYDPFVGEIKLLAFDFAPKNYALCQGQILAISQNTALFSLLGTQYGGNGTTTFMLPDLRGRVPIHYSSSINIGSKSGTETRTLLSTELPAHSHTVTAKVNNTAALNGAAANANHAVFVDMNGDNASAYNALAPNIALNTGTLTLANAGGSQSFDLMQPSLVLNYSISMFGVYPARN